MLRTREFLAALRAKATGTSGRKRITPEGFLDLRIPLPSPDEQRATVAAYEAATAAAAAKESEAAAIEARVAAEFETVLGIGPPPPLPDQPIFIASFGDLDRWSHEGILRNSLGIPGPVPLFPVLLLGTMGKVAYGLQKSPSNRPGMHARPYLRVANAQRNELDLRIIKTINVPDEEMPKYRLADGDILLCEGNSADLGRARRDLARRDC